MEKVKIAQIINTHGIRGELKLRSLSDFIDERLKKGHHVFIRFHDQDLEMIVKTHRSHKGFELVSFEEYQDINLVEKYKGSYVYDYKNDELLADDEYFVSDLIGCDVYDHDRLIGQVKDVQLLPHHDILIIEGKDKEYKIPYVKAFVINEDIENNRIDVQLIEGF